MFKSFLKNTGGNVAMMFTGASMLFMAGIGFAVDYNGMLSKRTVLQGYADAATLAAAASGLDTQAELQALAEKVVAENNFSGDTLTTTLTILEGSTIQVIVESPYDLVVMKMFRDGSIDLNAFAESPPRADGKINLALVLDVTDSMEGDKIDALKEAADDLVLALTDEDLDGVGDDGDTMISVVPFARYVQLPMSTATEPWMEITLEESCSKPVDWDNTTGCTEIDTSWTDDSGNLKTGTSTSCTNYAYFDEVCTTPVWEGCVGSRDFPWNTRDYYGGVRIRGMAKGMWCDDELLPLTNDVSAVQEKIDSMSTNDRTYIPAGLVWGWRTLMPGMPFTEANTPDKNKRKTAMLLMSDGGNTRSLSTSDPGYHWNTDIDDANDVTDTLCQNIKNDGIIIYVVAFDFDDDSAEDMLESCASDPEKFFQADDAEELAEAFEEVGLDLAQVRLSR